MKLCLDEHYSPEIADALRGRGHDVCSVKERPELTGLSDQELLARLVGEQRALLTENVADFMPLVQQAAAAGEVHYGLVFSSSRSLPRSRETIGLFVERLNELLQAHPGERDSVDRTFWLKP